MILYVLPFLIVNYRQMLYKRVIVLFALLSTFQVSISESRSILPLTTESDAVRRHDGEPAERRTDESSNDLVKMDGIELAVALEIRQSAATQVYEYCLWARYSCAFDVHGLRVSVVKDLFPASNLFILL